jgi:hypothetical protein
MVGYIANFAEVKLGGDFDIKVGERTQKLQLLYLECVESRITKMI